MKRSETIKEIAPALCKMQSALKPADKDNVNPAYKSRYSDINSAWEALREPLTKNGLAALQEATTANDSVSITTLVIHVSGEWIEFEPYTLPLGNKKDAQGYGSCTTYAKRYALCAALGITSSDEDDDANSACAPKPQAKNTGTPIIPHDMTKEEAMIHLARYEGDSIMILQFLLHRCDKFKSRLKDEVDSFIASESLAMAEFGMWKDAQAPKKKSA